LKYITLSSHLLHFFFRGTALDTPDNDIQDNIRRKRILSKILTQTAQILAILCGLCGVKVSIVSCGCSIGTSIFQGLWYLRLWIGAWPLSAPVGLLWGYCGPPWLTWMRNYDVEFFLFAQSI
jgi:hypothetical protein